MADLDLNEPLPDRAHEAVRVAILQTIADGADGFSLTDVAFSLINGLQAQVDVLTARLDALTPPV
jgi:hypothetical protein